MARTGTEAAAKDEQRDDEPEAAADEGGEVGPSQVAAPPTFDAAYDGAAHKSDGGRNRGDLREEVVFFDGPADGRASEGADAEADEGAEEGAAENWMRSAIAHDSKPLRAFGNWSHAARYVASSGAGT